MRFSDNLFVSNAHKVEPDSVQHYLLETVVREWKNSHSEAVRSSSKGLDRLEDHVQDSFNTKAVYGERRFRRFLSFMSKDLKNIVPWGLLPQNMS